MIIRYSLLAQAKVHMQLESISKHIIHRHNSCWSHRAVNKTRWVNSLAGQVWAGGKMAAVYTRSGWTPLWSNFPPSTKWTDRKIRTQVSPRSLSSSYYHQPKLEFFQFYDLVHEGAEDCCPHIGQKNHPAWTAADFICTTKGFRNLTDFFSCCLENKEYSVCDPLQTLSLSWAAQRHTRCRHESEGQSAAELCCSILSYPPLSASHVTSGTWWSWEQPATLI